MKCFPIHRKPVAVGLPWLAFSLQLDLEQTLRAGLYPFIIGGLVKAVVAAGRSATQHGKQV